MLPFFFYGFRSVFHGRRAYWIWVTALLILTLLGLDAYAKQLAYGLITTGMGDEVSWGLYIANFAFLVGMAAVMMVIPAYIFEDREMHKVVIFSLIGLAGIDARDNLQFNPSRGSTRYCRNPTLACFRSVIRFKPLLNFQSRFNQ